MALDQPCGKHGFARITQSEGDGAPGVPIVHQIGRYGRNHRADDDRQSRVAPKRDQDARGYARSRPEQGNITRFGENLKAQLCCREIGDTHRKGEPNHTNPRRAASQILQHVPPHENIGLP